MIGLSMRLCIYEILNGDVKESEVTWLITSTALLTPEEAYAGYGDVAWRKWSKEEAIALLTRLWPKIIQPRLIARETEAEDFNFRQIYLRTGTTRWVKTTSAMKAIQAVYPCENDCADHWYRMIRVWVRKEIGKRWADEVMLRWLDQRITASLEQEAKDDKM